MEMSVEDAGGKVLCTPPYFPYLQPIELHWSEGKINVSRHYYFGRSVKFTFSDMKDGWYGKSHCTPSGKWICMSLRTNIPIL